MIEILINDSYGLIGMTDEMKEIAEKYSDKSLPVIRMKLAKYVKENAKELPNKITYNSDIFEQYLKQHPSEIVKFNVFNKTYFCVYDDNQVKLLQIAAVDTSRKWYIDEYDGSEEIKYVDFEIVDSRFNYCKMR